MKLIIALVLSLGVYCAQAKEPYRVIDSKEIELRGDASYEIGAANPFTGSVVAHGPGGQKLLEQSIVNGKPEGATTVWYPDGKKGREI